MIKVADDVKHLSYIYNNLIKDLAVNLQIANILECNVKRCAWLDGYMSALYSVELNGTKRDTDVTEQYNFIVKFMKGDQEFRISTHSYTKFANETLLYDEIIPFFTAVLQRLGHEPPQWTAKAFLAKYGFIEGLSNCQQQEFPSYPEAVLVLENLKTKGYRLGYPMHLNHQHLLTMIRPLAEYHSLTHVLRLREHASLQRLIERIIPLQFKDVSKNSDSQAAASNEGNFNEVIYRLAFERFFAFFERWKANRIVMGPDDMHLVQNVERLRAKYGDSPIDLLESFRYGSGKNDDEYRRFAVILHGDFNRTNVLFQYHGDVPVDAKFIDFQLLRYGSPAIDLSFFLYLNMDPALRDELWMKLLEYYHGTMLNSLVRILKSTYGEDENTQLEKSLEQLCFKRFYQHFSRYAFYGAMLCMEIIPWMCSSEEDCNRLSFLYEKEMHGDELWKLSTEALGDDVNWRIFEVIRHCSRMGYMENL